MAAQDFFSQTQNALVSGQHAPADAEADDAGRGCGEGMEIWQAGGPRVAA